MFNLAGWLYKNNGEVIDCGPFIDYYASRMKQVEPSKMVEILIDFFKPGNWTEAEINQIKRNQQKEIKMQKMTREQAKAKLNKINWMDNSILDVLEALGLIEFEKKKTALETIESCDVEVYDKDHSSYSSKHCLIRPKSAENIIYALSENGYQIVKI